MYARRSDELAMAMSFPPHIDVYNSLRESKEIKGRYEIVDTFSSAIQHEFL